MDDSQAVLDGQSEGETVPASDSELLQVDLSDTPEELSSPFVSELADFGEAKSKEALDLVSADWLASETPESEEPRAPQATQVGSEEFPKSIDVFYSEKGIEETSNGQAATESALVEQLKSSDSAKREAALQQLAQLDEDAAFSLITNLFDDDSPETRNAAVRALYDFKPDRAGSLTRALREATADRRRRIATALADSGLATEAINSLAGESREKTYDAFSVLFLMAKAGEVKTLLKTIETHDSIPVQLSVIKLLTFSNQPEIVPAFRSLAVKGSLPTEIRSALMESIYQISNNARDLSAA
jgi:hypothetical protein